MGLIRYSQPNAATSSGDTDWTLSSGTAADAFKLIDDPFRTYTARGSGGGVTTDPVDDTDYIQFDGSGGAGKHTFGFQPIGGDDNIARLTFYVRARLTSGSATLITLGRRVSTTDSDIGTVTVPNQATFADLTLVSTADPSNSNAAWTTDNLSSDLEFYVSGPSAAYIARISRIYVQADFVVGPTLGKAMFRENWRWCDVCGTKTPYSRTQRPIAPHPQAGLVVCHRCYDQPDHDTIKILNASKPIDETDILY